MRKREGMEAFKLSIPSRFFTTKMYFFNPQDGDPVEDYYNQNT